MTMYNPPHFRNDDVTALHAAIRTRGFGSLVTVGEGGIEVSHVPMLVDPEPGPYGTLIGHIAKANPQWRTAKPEVAALAMFLGPDGYITPAWYATKQESGKVVPTWNYVAIHASGPLRFFHEPAPLLDVVTRLTDTHEAGRAQPWKVTDAPEDYVAGMLKGIVGFALTITKLEGKVKMSQNRPAPDRAGVVEGLSRDASETTTEIARLVRESSRE
jgi:transcriptional regulator